MNPIKLIIKEKLYNSLGIQIRRVDMLVIASKYRIHSFSSGTDDDCSDLMQDQVLRFVDDNLYFPQVELDFIWDVATDKI